MHAKLPLLLAATILLGATACSGNDTAGEPTSTTTTTRAMPERGNVDGTLRLGQLAPLSGSLMGIAGSLTTPVQLAVGEINAAGGVNGQPVGLVVGDDGTEAEPVAMSSLAKLLETDKVDAIVGPSTSRAALGMIETIRDQRALTCSGSTVYGELAEVDSGGYFFRTAPPDRLQGPALAELVAREGRKRPAIIARNDPYGLGLARTIRQELRGRSIPTAGPVVTYDPEAPNVDTPVQRVAERRPDSVIVIGSAPDGARVVAAMQAKGLGPAAVPVYTVDRMQSRDLGASVDPANPGVVSGMRGTAPAADPVGVDSPFDAALATTGTDPIFSAYYYDCAILTALAAVKAGSDDPAKMKEAFAKNLRGSTDCRTYAECKQALEAGKRIHYRGASSPFDRWDGWEPGQGAYEVWTYDAAGNVVTEPQDRQIQVPPPGR